MNEQEKARRKKIATLTVVVPITVGIIIVLLGHFLGNEHTEIPTPKETTTETEVERQAAPELAAAGTPAPRVRLTEAVTGQRLDSSSLGDAGYAVVFLSTKCEPIGDYLGRVARKLAGSGSGDVLVISADPEVDTPEAVTKWLAKHHIPAGAPVHYLVGDEKELGGDWIALWFSGARRARVPAGSPSTSSTGRAKTPGGSTCSPTSRPPSSSTHWADSPSRRRC